MQAEGPEGEGGAIAPASSRRVVETPTGDRTAVVAGRYRTASSCCPVHPAVGKFDAGPVLCVSESQICIFKRSRRPPEHPGPAKSTGVDYPLRDGPNRFQQLIDDGRPCWKWAEIHGGLHRSGTVAGPVRDGAVTAGQPGNSSRSI